MHSVSQVFKGYILLSVTLLLSTHDRITCELAKYHIAGEGIRTLRRPTVVIKKKYCPGTRCCGAQKEIVKSQGSATRELGRALRSAVEKGNSLQEAELRATRTEALAGPQNGFDAESALIAQGEADVHVLEKMATSGEKEFRRIKEADMSTEDDQAEFEKRRIEAKVEEGENEEAAVKSLELEELKLHQALDEEMSALEREISDTNADVRREHSRMAVELGEIEGKESSKKEYKLADMTREAEAKKSKSKEDLLANTEATIKQRGNTQKRTLEKAVNKAESVEAIASDGNSNIGDVESAIESRLKSTESKTYGESNDSDEDAEEKSAIRHPQNKNEEKDDSADGKGLFLLFKYNTNSTKSPPFVPTLDTPDISLEMNDIKEIPSPNFEMGNVERAVEPSDAEPWADGDVDDMQELHWVRTLLQTDMAKYPDFAPEKPSVSWWNRILFGVKSSNA